MTSLDMLQTLKRDRNTVLWIAADLRQARFHDGHCGHVVDYEEAMLVRPDPAIGVEQHEGGEILYAI